MDKLAELFPLPLTPWETYMLRASWSGDPMNNDCTWLFRGTLHRESFEQALQHAMQVNPLFSCRVDWSVRGRPRWILSHDKVQVHWDETPPAHWYDDFDLTVEAGIRVWVGPFAQGISRLSIRSHHAISDGMGYGRFYGDLFHRYSVLRSPPGAAMTAWADPEPELLKLRDSIAIDRTPLARLRSGLKMLHMGLAQPPRPLAVPSSKTEGTWSDVKLAWCNVEGAAFDRLRAFVKARNITLNDYMVASLFRTLVAWNERHGSSLPNDRLRIMVPTSGRDRRHAAMPAANCVGFSITDRLAGDCADADSLLSSVARDLRTIREQHLGASYVDILSAGDAVARVRGKLVPRKRTRRSTRCAATAVLSYFGDVDRLVPGGGPRDADSCHVCGDISLVKPLALVSRQDQTRVGLTALYIRKELVIALNPDHTYFDSAHAQEFLELYKSQLLADAQVDRDRSAEASAPVSAE
mgnify:CR=1 FL=1